MRSTSLALFTLLIFLFASCKKDDPAPETPITAPTYDCLGVANGTATAGTACDDGDAMTFNDIWTSNCECSGSSELPRLILKFRFDNTQVRLNGFGQPEPVLPAGHAAQHPRFNTMSSHYVEFAPTAWTLPGQGSVVYHAPETTAGGANAIDHSQGVHAANGETFMNIPLSQLPAGSYPYLRVSLAYQNYNIDFRYTDPTFGVFDLTGTLASFIGFNTYISTFTIDQQTLTVNDDKPQGFWAFEVNDPIIPTAPVSGQAPGVTTVPNPLFASSPIPANSCLVTGEFASPLVITGNETSDVVIMVSLSTNNSFEWTDNGDGIFEPGAGDVVVDMGIRGLIPIVQ